MCHCLFTGLTGDTVCKSRDSLGLGIALGISHDIKLEKDAKAVVVV